MAIYYADFPTFFEKSAFFLKFIRILILILTLQNILTSSFVSSHEVTDNSCSSSGFSLPVLQKCGDSEEISNVTFLVIPSPNRVTGFGPLKLQEYQRKLDRFSATLYNFTLVDMPDSNSQLCGGFYKELHQNSIFQSDGADSSPLNVTLDIFRERPKKPKFLAYFDPRGFLVYFTPSKQQIHFHPKNYCVLKADDRSIQVRVCTTPCTSDPLIQGPGSLCVPKCCPIGQKMASNGVGCVKGNDTDDGEFSQVVEWTETGEEKLVKDVYPNFLFNGNRDHLISWNCSKPEKNSTDVFQAIQVLPLQSKEIHIFTNGSIYNRRKLGHFIKWELLYSSSSPSPSFRPPLCIDAMHMEMDKHGLRKSSIPSVSGKNYNFLSRNCKKTILSLENHRDKDNLEFEQFKYERTIVYPQIKFWIFLIACFVYLCTLTVYIILWDKQNVHGWTVFMWNLCNFLLSFGFLVQNGMNGYSDVEPTRLLQDLFPLCLTLGIGIHLLMIASFAWTTILSFDAWTKLQSMTATKIGYRGEKKFLLYCLFGFGAPITWILLAVTIEFSEVPGDSSEILGNLTSNISKSAAFCEKSSQKTCGNRICPGYSTYCSIYRPEAYYIYTLLPLSVLFFFSMIFASMTVHFIFAAKKSISTLKDSRSTSKSHNNAKLACKIFLMMGVLLIFEVVQSIYNPVITSMAYVILDFYRLLHAFTTFWIFAVNERTLKSLGEKITFLRVYTESSMASQSTATTRNIEQTPTSTRKLQVRT